MMRISDSILLTMAPRKICSWLIEFLKSEVAVFFKLASLML